MMLQSLFNSVRTFSLSGNDVFTSIRIKLYISSVLLLWQARTNGDVPLVSMSDS